MKDSESNILDQKTLADLNEERQHDMFFMEEALRFAEKARGRTSPNPIVGAVLVQDGRMTGKGYHQRAGLPHAEVEALQDVSEDPQGATWLSSSRKLTSRPQCPFRELLHILDR